MNEFMKWLYGKKIEREMNKSADKINVEKIRTWIKKSNLKQTRRKNGIRWKQ